MSSRALIYHDLAELLSPPPPWLTSPGAHWPLYQDASGLSELSPAARQAVTAIGTIPAESMAERTSRYESVFMSRPLCLYESAAKMGRILGTPMLEVQRWYTAAGLQIAQGAELPDHASVELAFLGCLAQWAESDRDRASEWHSVERRFLAEHGDWLVDLGELLADSGDLVYAPVGRFLAWWLAEQASASSAGSRERLARRVRPSVREGLACTLCGHCVQACPEEALAIRDTAQQTMLWLSDERCIGCGRCIQVCEPRALSLRARDTATSDWHVLFRSPRAICPGCGRATVSQAELAYVEARIGSAPWIAYCPECRGG